MGLYDRDYTQDNYGSQFRYAPQMRPRLPRLMPMVKWLLIANVAVFFVSIIIPPLGSFLFAIGSLDPTSIGKCLQLWRLITYQFLHGDIWHIAFNMLGLYFLGPTLERHWGSKRFLKFYLGCGAAGGLFYMLLVAIRFLEAGPMIGASGSILGMLAACAILFPQFIVLILFFPVPIRVAAIMLTAVYLVFVITRGHNAGGHAAHLAGLAAGAAYVFFDARRTSFKVRFGKGAWERKLASQQRTQEEIDRILDKIHESGMQSLTPKERQLLRQATEAEQRDRR